MGRSTEASFALDHSEVQKEYVLWKYERLREWVTTEPKVLTRSYHKDRTRQLASFRFQTLSHPEFTHWYKLFYPNGVKAIPENVDDILVSPLSLAVWFMDDGNKNHKAVFLNTQQFQKTDQERLLSCLRKNFGLEGTLNKHSAYNGKQLYRIRVDTASTRRLSTLIGHYLLPSLKYKIPVCPRNDFSLGGRGIAELPSAITR